MRRQFQIAAALLLAGTSLAQAETNEERIARELTEQGFSNIEITRENGLMKVEALRGSNELEITYDMSTGAVVRQELEPRSDLPGRRIEDDRRGHGTSGDDGVSDDDDGHDNHADDGASDDDGTDDDHSGDGASDDSDDDSDSASDDGASDDDSDHGGDGASDDGSDDDHGGDDDSGDDGGHDGGHDGGQGDDS